MAEDHGKVIVDLLADIQKRLAMMQASLEDLAKVARAEHPELFTARPGGQGKPPARF